MSCIHHLHLQLRFRKVLNGWTKPDDVHCVPICALTSEGAQLEISPSKASRNHHIHPDLTDLTMI